MLRLDRSVSPPWTPFVRYALRCRHRPAHSECVVGPEPSGQYPNIGTLSEVRYDAKGFPRLASSGFSGCTSPMVPSGCRVFRLERGRTLPGSRPLGRVTLFSSAVGASGANGRRKSPHRESFRSAFQARSSAESGTDLLKALAQGSFSAT